MSRSLGLGRGRRIRRIAIRIALIAAVVAAAVAAVWWWRTGREPAPPRYVTAAVTRGELAVTVTATGTLEARHVVDVGSEVSGRMRRLLVDFNDRVTAGQLIAELDPAQFEAELASATAALREARAQLAKARVDQREAAQNHERADGLYAHGVISLQDRETATAAAARADAGVEVATASVAQTAAAQQVAATNLARTAIRAPMDGIVLDRHVEPGQTVVATLQAPVIYTIAEDLTAMRVVVDVDEADIGLVTAGQPATFTVAAYLGREFPATVKTVHAAGELVDRVVSYEAELDVDNAELLLHPGMTVTARIVARSITDALTVPNQALRFSPVRTSLTATEQPTQPQVWVLRDGAPVAVPVQVGVASDARTEVRSAELGTDDAVIVDAR